MTRTLLVASPGGHVDELRLLSDQLGVDADAVWITARTPHTESVLSDAEVVWVPRIGSGQRVRAAAALPSALALHRRLRPGLVVSTGAMLAVPHLLAAAAYRCETRFVDSAARVHGPSATGRFAQRLPRVQVFSQGAGWGDPRWQSIPGVLDGFEVDAATAPDEAVGRVVVTLGTERWPFPRAARRILEIAPDADFVWQTGATTVIHEGRELNHWLPAPELRAAIRDADVVISHAGVGSALAALEQGKVPVFLPRRRVHGEHVDDHQREVADLLAGRSLAVVADPDELGHDHLRRAAAMRVRRPRVPTLTQVNEQVPRTG